MTTDELIHKMLDVASDPEADVLDDLLVKAGYWWRCEAPDGSELCGFAVVGQPCENCGSDREDLIAELENEAVSRYDALHPEGISWGEVADAAAEGFGLDEYERATLARLRQETT